jgi:hypothetical protein
MMWLSTGPGLITRVFAQAVAGEAAATPLDHSIILDSGSIRRTVALHCRLGYMKTDKHWTRMAFKRVAAAQGRPATASVHTAKILANPLWLRRPRRQLRHTPPRLNRSRLPSS